MNTSAIHLPDEVIHPVFLLHEENGHKHVEVLETRKPAHSGRDGGRRKIESPSGQRRSRSIDVSKQPLVADEAAMQQAYCQPKCFLSGEKPSTTHWSKGSRLNCILTYSPTQNSCVMDVLSSVRARLD